MKKWSVKNLKTWTGMDGHGYQGTLYYGKKRVGTFVQAGQGAPAEVEWMDAAAERACDKLIAAKPIRKEEVFGKMLEMKYDLDEFLVDLVDAFEHQKWMKRNCKNKTIFSMPGDKEGQYRTLKHAYTPEVKAFILKNYPEATIWNERL